MTLATSRGVRTRLMRTYKRAFPAGGAYNAPMGNGMPRKSAARLSYLKTMAE
jgi:hypothetical protein